MKGSHVEGRFLSVARLPVCVSSSLLKYCVTVSRTTKFDELSGWLTGLEPAASRFTVWRLTN